ncbi:MAG: DUF192 domain-containing protein [bacterium]
MKPPGKEIWESEALAKVGKWVDLHFGTGWRKSAILKGSSLRFPFRSGIQARNITIGLIAILPILTGCQSASQEKHKPAEAETQGQNAEHLPRIMVGNIPLRVEIVQTDEERMRGLMFREKLPEGQGMLFVFEHSSTQSFWMRNTFIALDIAFIDADGRIVDIQRMEPLDETRSYLSPAPVPYVLEVNAGWFTRHGLKAGDIVKF